MSATTATGTGGRAATATTVIWICAGLALATALLYALLAASWLPVKGLEATGREQTIVVVAAACYALGGLLVLARRRWLWIMGAVMNALVIVTYLGFYLGRPDVLFCTLGVLSKGLQTLLEVGLIYLSVTHKPDTGAPAPVSDG